MIKLGVNSVLFGGFDFATAARHIALAGYDGVEVSAIMGMRPHLDLDNWKGQTGEIRRIALDNGLELLALENGPKEEQRLMHAFEAAAEIGIPVVNVGPGGKSDAEDDLQQSIVEKNRDAIDHLAVFLVIAFVKRIDITDQSMLP